MDPKQQGSKKKVLLIGWDAADWKVIDPMLEKGHLPNLQKLIERGVMGKLASLDPPYSPMLWTSIATGKRPFKHGIHGFTEVAPNRKTVRPSLGSSRGVKAIWNILTQKNYKTHVVGWWPSHPAEPVNGMFISDFFQKANVPTPDLWKLPADTIWPEKAIERFSPLRVHPLEISSTILEAFIPDVKELSKIPEMLRRINSVRKITAEASSLHAAFTRVLRNNDWDFGAIYLDAIDHYCHGFMRFHPPKREHIPQNLFDHFHKVVESGYRFHDMMLGRLLDLATEETTVILVSDHGFQPAHLRPTNIPKETAGPAFEHSPYGIIVMAGPNIKKDELIHGASLLDITPTILNILGEPVADDMDGRVLGESFVKQLPYTRIRSWEEIDGESGMPDPNYELGENHSVQARKQLQQLGYIDGESGRSIDELIKKTEKENEFNLARAYIDADLVHEATPLLKNLFDAYPNELRFGLRLANCYQRKGAFAKSHQVIDDIETRKLSSPVTLQMMRANLMISEQRIPEALQIFEKISKDVPDGISRIHMQMANSLVRAERWAEAEEHIEKELILDPENAWAHQLKGVVYLQTGRFSSAAQSFIDAIGLRYDTPQNHFNLAQALFNLGEYGDAAKSCEVALQLDPELGMARVLAIRIYTLYAPNEEKQLEHEASQKELSRGRVVIVSGLPRSGTSMMMQMLQAGGLEVFTDQKRSADESNPIGYLEHDLVKSLPKNNNWMYRVTGKAIKVVTPLLTHLPKRYRYKVIHMQRDFREILASQQSMLKRAGSEQQGTDMELIQAYQQEIQKAVNWAIQTSSVDMMHLEHKKVIENPFEAALKVQEFLQDELEVEAMARVVDKRLYRNKLKSEHAE